jgi:uncharacterized protein (TIGR03437 family)
VPSPAQFIQQGPKLVGSGIVGPGARQGASVALSTDGNTLIVGGTDDNAAVGATWVFTRNGDAWSQQGGKLVGSGLSGPTAAQGSFIGLSADGNTALVGGSLGIAAAWVFTRSNGLWTQQGPKLIPSIVAGNLNSAALSGDGNTAVLGLLSKGAFVFTRSAGVWTQQATLTPRDAAGSFSGFGSSLALSFDGSTIAVGGDGDTSSLGATWVFSRSGGVWTQQGPKLVGSGSVGASYQGFCVALSADGNTLMTGGLQDANYNGAVWFFTRASGVWTQQGAKLTDTEPRSEYGWSVALSADGNSAMVGTPQSSLPLRILKRINGSWTQQGPGLVGTGVVGSVGVGVGGQGFQVAISGDGDTVAAGGLYDNELFTGSTSETATGATWVFGRARLTVSTAPSVVAGIPSSFAVTLTGPGDVAQSSYVGQFSFASTDTQAVLPAASKLTNGAGTFPATFKTPGIHTITASNASGVAGTSNAVSVRAAVVQVSPANASLQYYRGTDPLISAPAILTVSSDVSLLFSVAAADPWLTVSPNSATAPASITVRANPTALNPGNYSSSVVIVLADGRSYTVPVSLVVYGLPQLKLSAASPNPVVFSVRADSPALQTSDLAVEADVRNIAVQVSTTSSTPGVNWLSVGPAGGTTPLGLHIVANPAGLTTGTFQARITIASSDAGNSPLVVLVTLNVLPPAPAISVAAFANAASFISGPAAPNTLMSAFGVFPDCSGAQVSLNNRSATVFASTPNQINFLVPPDAASTDSMSVRISCAGLNSEPIPLPIVATAPGLFTASAQGTGQAAVVNEDGSAIPPSAPGTVVTLYATGLGLFGDPESDGLARVALPVTAFVGGRPATVLYAGEAPGFTSGLQQVNLRLPAELPRGADTSVRLTVGAASTQVGVTLAIQ